MSPFSVKKPNALQSSIFRLFPVLIICLAVLCVYAPSLNYGFINWDDSHFVYENTHLDMTWANLKLYFTRPFLDICSPLTLVSFMADHAIAPNSALVCRVHNLLLHILSAVLVFGIGKELQLGVRSATLIALLWALNPQKVESVCWISERKDVLCGFLAFGAIYAFQLAVRKERMRWVWLSGVLCVLSILAKPASVTIAGVLFAYLVCMWRNKHTREEYIRFFAPAAILNMAAIAYSFAITFQTNPGKAETNLLVPLHNIFWYPVTALFPFLPMTPCAVYPPVPVFGKELIATFTAGFGLLIAGIILTYFIRRKIPVLYVCGWGFAILCAIAPVAGMLAYTNFTHCDRYNYIVSALVLLAVGVFFRAYMGKSRVLVFLCGVILAVVFVLQTRSYLPHWESAERLFRRNLEQSIRYGGVPPNTHTVQNSLELWLNNENAPEHRILADLLLSFPAETWDCYKGEEGTPVQASLLLARIHLMDEDDPGALALAEELREGIVSKKYTLFSSLSETYLRDMLRFSRANIVMDPEEGTQESPSIPDTGAEEGTR